MVLKNKYPQDGRKVFVRYGNRKLYDIVTHEYTTVAAVAKLPLGSFVVYEHSTKEDITSDVLLSALNTHFSNNKEAFESVKTDLVTRFLQN